MTRLIIIRYRLYRWVKTGKKHLNLFLILLLCGGIGIFAMIGYKYNVAWTGFLNKSLWDWMQLLIIPLVLALGGYLYNRSHDKAERATTLDNQREAALQAYYDRISELLLNKAMESDPGAVVIANARTEAIMRSLDPLRATYLLKFLSEANLLEKGIGRNSPGLTLREMNLSYFKLQKINLSNAQMQQVNLVHTNLRNACLSFAMLQEATLDDADLSNARLSNANLTDAISWGASYRNADLRGAVLKNVNFGEADFSNANLSYANLKKACLFKTNLEGANLTGANLTGADLTGANLKGTNLAGANLEGVDLKEVDLTRAVTTK